MEYVWIVKMVAPWVVAGAVAYGGVRAGLNGQKEKLNALSKRHDTHIVRYNNDSTKIVKSLTRLETQVGLILDHKIKE